MKGGGDINAKNIFGLSVAVLVFASNNNCWCIQMIKICLFWCSFRITFSAGPDSSKISNESASLFSCNIKKPNKRETGLATLDRTLNFFFWILRRVVSSEKLMDQTSLLSGSELSDLIKLSECSVCLEQRRDNRILNPCGHTLCSECLRFCLTKTGKGDKICPECKQKFVALPTTSHYTKNYVKNHLVQFLKNCVENRKKNFEIQTQHFCASPIPLPDLIPSRFDFCFFLFTP